MNDWKKTEIQSLNDYLGNSNMFKETDEKGMYAYEIEGLKIAVKPTGDYNFELSFNGEGTIENALELTGDTVIEALKFWIYNNDTATDKVWADFLSGNANVLFDLSGNSEGGAKCGCKLVIIMGLPTSGKRFLLNKNYSDMYVIDSDIIKTLMKGHENDHPEWTHARSKVMEKSLCAKALGNNDSFVLITNGANAERLKEVIAEAHAQGYIVDLLYVKSNMNDYNEINRCKTIQIPTHLVDEMIKSADITFEAICPLADKSNVVEIKRAKRL